MMLADSNEPDNLIKLLSQAVDTSKQDLNRQHMSDYYFANFIGKTFQFSRKQAGELVGNLDEAEDQIRDYYNQADENYQIVEGILSPVRIMSFPLDDHSIAKGRVSTRDLGAKIYCYQVQPNGFISKGHSFSAISVGVLYAWIHRLAQSGVTTYWTINWIETAKLLATIYRNEQKPPEEHTTLKRVIRPHIFTHDPDPLVRALMSLSIVYKIGIGEDKARALADRFVNLLDIATATREDITDTPGIGNAVANKLLHALGREV